MVSFAEAAVYGDTEVVDDVLPCSTRKTTSGW
jgi:hypothetical protein